MKVTDKFVLFWGDYIGNWTSTPLPIKFSTSDPRFHNPAENPFLDIHTFPTSEHLFMYLKAMFFKNYEVAEKIEHEPSPKEAKKLGRLVKGFLEDEWTKVRYEVMFNAVYRRSSYDFKFRELIKKPEWRDLEFVEASPYDKVWGIGLSQDDPKASVKKMWPGLNLLGQALGELRKRLLWEDWIRERNLREFHEDLIWCPSQIYYWFPSGPNPWDIKVVYMRWRWHDPWSIEVAPLTGPSFDSWELEGAEDITENVGFFRDSEYMLMEEKVVEYLKNTYPGNYVAEDKIIRKDPHSWTGTNIII